MSSRSLNKAMLIGNLTRDPELRYTPSGTAVCSFGLATNRSWMPSDSNERREETEFHRIVAWNKLAELCSQLLTKGRKVYVEGRLQTRSWETGDGEKRQTTEIVAEDMVILDQRKDGPREEKEEGKDEETVEQKAEKSEDVKEGEDKEKADKKDVKGQKEKSEKKNDEEKAEKEEGKEEEIDIDDIPF
ncbi:MAG: single-stranded DNA-binding protein [Candidatus Woykebacteria bacterium]